MDTTKPKYRNLINQMINGSNKKYRIQIKLTKAHTPHSHELFGQKENEKKTAKAKRYGEPDEKKGFCRNRRQAL